MLKKLAVVSLIASALILSAPSIATASAVPAESGTYADTPDVEIDDAIVTTCEVSTVTFGVGYFTGSETVSVAVSGKNAGAARISGNTAAPDGSLIVTFRPPADGEGIYALAFTGTAPAAAPAALRGSGSAAGSHMVSTMRSLALSTVREYTATITVSNGHGVGGCATDPSVAPTGTELPLTGGTELALTGGSASPWIVGGGAFALIVGGVLVAVGVSRRKNA